MASYEELQADVKAAVKEIDLAIALASLVRKFNVDDRIGEVFDNTYEAHPFVMCRSSVEYCLALALVRCHDRRRDSHGLTRFFELIDKEETRRNLSEGILNRRREWVNEEAQRETTELVARIGEAQQLHAALRESHQYARVIEFRHSHVAHRARHTEHIQPTQRVWFYELIDSSKEIVQILCGSVLGVTEDFTGGAEIWEDYTCRFFDVMMERAPNP